MTTRQTPSQPLPTMSGYVSIGYRLSLALCLSLVAIVLQKFVLARDEPKLTTA